MLLVTISLSVIGIVYVVKRLHRHPLSKYPGPVVAALTQWYRIYYDVIRDGSWASHLETLHKQYGPIVRVGPNDLHFSDPEAYHDIYGMGTRFAKEHTMYTCLSNPGSVFAMSDHQEAMDRRNLMGPFFSRKSILNFERTVQKKVDHLVSRLSEYRDSKKSANLEFAFRSLGIEIVTTYCFGCSSNALDAKDFENEILTAIDYTTPMIWVFKHFPVFRELLLGIPDDIASILKPVARGVIKQRQQMGAQIDSILEDPSSLENYEHKTIFHHFLNADPAQYKVPPVARHWLLDEGLYLRFAGSDTVGHTCTIAAFYLLHDEKARQKLFASLLEVWPDGDACPGYEALEKVPYLTAVIKEALRMGHGVVTPLPRVIGPGPARIAGEVIPQGTIVSMGASIMHRNATVFPNPYQFLPERWLQSDSAELDKYLVAFSKGPRSCLGINLAWCELYLAIGTVFRKLDFIADNASLEDINYREYLVPVHRGKHLHAFVRPTDV